MIPVGAIPFIGVLVLAWLLFTMGKTINNEKDDRKRKKYVIVILALFVFSAGLYFGIKQTKAAEIIFPQYYQVVPGDGTIDLEQFNHER